MSADYYLRHDTKIEPLIARWHAHSLLISPPSAAFMARYHLSIMESFVLHPELHRSALGKPELRYGPFVDGKGPEDVDEVRLLIEEYRETHAELLGLADQIEALFRRLREQKGFSLEPLYAGLEPALKGRVELAYESSGAARFRLLEPLFYAAYPPESHQELALGRVDTDDRPYLMSTPRFESTGDTFLRLPFGSESARTLCQAREHPVTDSQIDEWYEAQSGRRRCSREEFGELFSRQAPPSPTPNEPSLRFVGHACVLISTGRENLLIDPLLSYRFPGQSPRLSLADLPETIDCALVTHAHRDHYVIETLLQIRGRVGRLVVPGTNPGDLLDPSLKLMSQHLGFDDVVELQPFDTLELESIRVRALPFLGEHGDLDLRSKLGYRFELDDTSIGFFADSNNLDPRLYEHLRDFYGPLDTTFIGLECKGAPVSWAYGPLLFGALSRGMDESRRTGGSNAERALKLIVALGCRRVFIYAMAFETWLRMFGGEPYDATSSLAREAKALIAECSARGIEARLLDGSVPLPL